MTVPSKLLPALLSADQAAALLGLSTRTVRRLIETNELHAHWFGRSVRISQDDLNTFIAKSRK